MSVSRQVRLASRPVGEVKPSNWELVEAEIPQPGEHQFTVQITHLSIDPAMRGWMNAGRSYVPPVQIGEVMRALGLGRVVASAHPNFSEGDLVQGTFGVQEHALSDGEGVQKLPPATGASPATYLGILGM